MGLKFFLDLSYEVLLLLFLLFYFPYIFNFVTSLTLYYKTKKRENATSYSQFLKIKDHPKFTFIVPEYNEETLLIPVVNTILNLSYPNLEVIVIDNGSTDTSLKLLKDRFKLFALPPIISQEIPTKEIKNYYRSKTHTNLFVIEKSDKEKADGQNAALSLCDSPYVIFLDADTFIEDEAFMKMINYFLSNPSTRAVGSLVGVANECVIENDLLKQVVEPKNILLRFQQLNYQTSIIGSRFGEVLTGGDLIIPGALGMYCLEDVLNLKGLSDDTLLDDVDLTIALHKK